MSNDVFANGREISCKKADGKSICAFPDVCMTPPENPATPPGIPIPYPNTGMAADTTSGSKKVRISNKEVLLKNKSYFKKSVGDEAGCAAKKGVLTSTNRGKVYFNMWSMDVKVEGENVVRHLDITTHNHMSMPGNSPTWPYLDAMAFSAPQHPCNSVAKAVDQECSKHIKKTKKDRVKRSPSIKAMCADPKCKDAMKCVLQPHKSKKASNNCCGDKTTHHLVPSSAFIPNANRGPGKDPVNNYSDIGAPCLCVQGKDHNDPTSEHGKVGRKYKRLLAKARKPVTLKKSIEMGAESATVVGCPKECVEAQLKHGHRQMKLSVAENDPVPRQRHG